MSSRQPPTTSAPPKISITPLPSSLSSPIPTSTITLTISGHPTTVIAQSFVDRIFIIVTQLSKFGCLYQASTTRDPSSTLLDSDSSTTDSTLPPPLPTTSITKLVGTEPSPSHTALYQLYVAQIASIVTSTARREDARPLVVSLALKPTASAQVESRVADVGLREDDDEEDSLMSSEEERKRYMGVMDAVKQCRVW
ncbi:Proteasome assembly chaperone 3 [Pseudozyma hubeiensis]|nr:Proteasome assembly chaperone 3 [Pseudozyma hubeiensis]